MAEETTTEGTETAAEGAEATGTETETGTTEAGTQAAETGAETEATTDAGTETGKDAKSEGKTETKPSGEDWRNLITDDAAKKEAERTTDLNSAFKRIAELRGQLSKAVIPPGKDAGDDEWKDYRKKIGVPEEPDKYEIKPSDDVLEKVPDELKPDAEGIAERLDEFKKRMHATNATPDQLNEAVNFYYEMAAQDLEAQNRADKEFADQQLEELQKEMGADFEKNKAIANETAKRLFGNDLEQVRNLQTTDGRFVLDHAPFVKLLASIGREMPQDQFGAVTAADRDSINEKIEEIRKAQDEAAANNDSKKANELYQQEQQLIARRDGNKPAVGAQGRTA